MICLMWWQIFLWNFQAGQEHPHSVPLTSRLTTYTRSLDELGTSHFSLH